MTACYLAGFLGSLGSKSDERMATTILRESRKAKRFELFFDNCPTRPVWERLLVGLRAGRVNRLVVRYFADLCLTSPEIKEFGSLVIDPGLDFVRVVTLPPSVLLAGYPRRLGIYRHRQREAKTLWLRRHGYTINEICHMAHSTPQQVARVLLAHRCLAPLPLF